MLAAADLGSILGTGREGDGGRDKFHISMQINYRCVVHE